MPQTSPIQVLDTHADEVRSFVVHRVLDVHDRFADAHQMSGTNYGYVFGGQWRDLLDAVRKAATDRGYRTYSLPPGGQRLPVINGCLLYAWRVPDSARTVSSFASSPTRRSGFTAPPLDPMLFEPGFTGEAEELGDWLDDLELKGVVGEAQAVMPLVLVMVRSTPRRLQSIDWAVAELEVDRREVILHGLETIWEPEPIDGALTASVDSFDSGTPTGPKIEPQEEANRPDA
ncbi:hypothetical protein SAMN05216184_11953 [Georgenia satyanarayanai]|uniref:Uncharacterized protein n=1 Tax=Georgenia satyanarayanai TaxID=860221 RepID=A0A2Y9AR69_9MICO|nr:hypothetical protein [Georgenia satyanarayanai]PYF96393.1 hypothetical protein A8987_11953 [Georgenia satyanarayanai]SSA46951.1 hypothetical protein SAMN05216184_11953 [Georgenia satyanarayanai]